MGQPHDEQLKIWQSEMRNFHSFYARVSGQVDFLDGARPVWEAIVRLEEAVHPEDFPDVEQESLDHSLWAASEWLIYCADILFEKLNQPKMRLQLSKDFRHSDASDADVDDAGKIKRWEFWKERLSERLVARNKNDEVAQHVSDALKSMEAAEKKYKPTWAQVASRHRR